MRIRPNRGVRCRAVCENLPCKNYCIEKTKTHYLLASTTNAHKEFLKSFRNDLLSLKNE